MTLNEFLEKHNGKKFYINNLEFLVHKDNNLDPITHMCNEELGTDFNNNKWREAAKKLGINFQDARKIIGTCDNWKNYYDEDLRNDLLR